MIFKEVMREYDRARTQSRRELEHRRMEVYGIVPRMEEIENELAQAGIKLARLVLNGGAGAHEAAGRFKEELTSLHKEKEKLLAEHGFAKDYLSNLHNCLLCQDTGYQGSVKCACLRQKRIDSCYHFSNVAAIVASENFDTFDFRYYSDKADDITGVSPLVNMQTAFATCLRFTTEFGKEFQNLLFYGDTGLGKTFLCHCIAKELLDKGKTVLYVTAPQLFKKIEDMRFNREEMEVPAEQLDMLYSAELLIVDDLGSEFSTIVTNTELFNIINTRILEKRSTVISTNLALNDFQNHYSDRIVSRLFGNYHMIRFFGDDIRIKKRLGV